MVGDASQSAGLPMSWAEFSTVVLMESPCATSARQAKQATWKPCQPRNRELLTFSAHHDYVRNHDADGVFDRSAAGQSQSGVAGDAAAMTGTSIRLRVWLMENP